MSAKFNEEVEATRDWMRSSRFDGIVRLYAARQVVEQRGTIRRADASQDCWPLATGDDDTNDDDDSAGVVPGALTFLLLGVTAARRRRGHRR